MMEPRIVIPEEEYKEAFRHYVFGLAEKWLELDAAAEDAGVVAERIGEASRSNYRVTYLPYMLAISDAAGYAGLLPPKAARAMHKVLYNLRLNDVPYNDYMLKRFCGIMLKDVDERGLYAESLPEDYKDLQKLVWTFIQRFRRQISDKYGADPV